MSIFRNCSGSQVENIKKHLQNVFQNNGLDVVNYLGVNFNLILPKTRYRNPIHKCGI